MWEAASGMARFGISPENTLGISIPALRKMAKEMGKNHALAQMESWAADLDSWDICDQVCSNLFDKTRFAYQKAHELK